MASLLRAQNIYIQIFVCAYMCVYIYDKYLNFSNHLGEKVDIFLMFSIEYGIKHVYVYIYVCTINAPQKDVLANEEPHT